MQNFEQADDLNTIAICAITGAIVAIIAGLQEGLANRIKNSFLLVCIGALVGGTAGMIGVVSMSNSSFFAPEPTPVIGNHPWFGPR